MERSVWVRSDRNIQVHLWRWTNLTTWTDRTGIYRSIFINWSVALLQLRRHVALGNGTQNGNDHSVRLARFNQEMSFHVALVYLG